MTASANGNLHPTGQRILSLQALRFVAAGMVVVFHMTLLGQKITGVAPSSDSIRMMSVGAGGVDIFFVLSGFIIATVGPLAEPRPVWSRFLWLRWSRVAPVYFLLSLPLVVFAFAHGGLHVDRLIATFLFWPNRSMPYLDQGWTLCYEMIFYASVCIFMSFSNLTRYWTLFTIVVTLETLSLTFNAIYLEFLMGVVIALIHDRRPKIGLGWGFASLGLGVVAFLALARVGAAGLLEPDVTMSRHGAMRVWLFGPPAALIVFGALVCDPLCRGGWARLLSVGGDASYSLYLTHTLCISAIVALWAAAHLPIWLAPIAAFAGSVAVAVACLHYIERPILRDLRRIGLGRMAAATA